MSSTYQITEDCINNAINALHDGDYSNPTAAARAFGVNPKTVQRRLQGAASKSSRLPTNRALNLEQAQAIRDYIERLMNKIFQLKCLWFARLQTTFSQSLILILLYLLLKSAKVGLSGFLIVTHNITKKNKSH